MARWIQWVLVGLLIASILSACKPGPSETGQTVSTILATGSVPATALEATAAGSLVCPSDFCRRIHLEEVVMQQCAQTTSASLDEFKKLTLEMNFTQVCKAVGAPAWEAGSGLLIYVYELADGSRVLVGFAGPAEMVYVNQLLVNGETRPLLTRP